MKRALLTRFLLVVALLLAIGPAFPTRQTSAQVIIPAGATITNATLYLQGAATDVATINVYRITSDWDELAVTWNNFHPDNSITSGLDSSTIWGSFPAASGPISVDVTNLVKAWVNGTYPNKGLLLDEVYPSSYSNYYSSESTTISYRPKLVITFADGTSSTIQRPGDTHSDVFDASILQSEPTSNLGNDSTLSLWAGWYNGFDKQTLVRFDFSVVAPASLGDFVWNDLDRDGIQDAGEPGIPNVPVHLYTPSSSSTLCSDGTLLASTATDANGKYLFSNLMPGTYCVVFDKSGFANFSPQYMGGNPALDSNANPTTGQTGNITLNSGENNLTIDAGLYSVTTSAGTGTPGYWMNHPNAWPVPGITVGGTYYTRDQAIAAMKAPTAKDMTYAMFQALVAAKLNVAVGCDNSCIKDTISAADTWMSANPLGSKVKASSDAWQKSGSSLYKTLDAYNNGLLCAPHRN